MQRRTVLLDSAWGQCCSAVPLKLGFASISFLWGPRTWSVNDLYMTVTIFMCLQIERLWKESAKWHIRCFEGAVWLHGIRVYLDWSYYRACRRLSNVCDQTAAACAWVSNRSDLKIMGFRVLLTLKLFSMWHGLTCGLHCPSQRLIDARNRKDRLCVHINLLLRKLFSQGATFGTQMSCFWKMAASLWNFIE